MVYVYCNDENAKIETIWYARMWSEQDYHQEKGRSYFADSPQLGFGLCYKYFEIKDEAQICVISLHDATNSIYRCRSVFEFYQREIVFRPEYYNQSTFRGLIGTVHTGELIYRFEISRYKKEGKDND